jgi:hypothetical protein
MRQEVREAWATQKDSVSKQEKLKLERNDPAYPTPGYISKGNEVNI